MKGTRNMRKGAIKALVLTIVFILTVMITGVFTNKTNEDLTMEMADATLPVVTLYENDVEINELHGYTTDMQAQYMRDTITPIGEDRILPVTIQCYQTQIDAISYEIRSLNAERLIADSTVTDYQQNGSSISLELEIQNLLEEGQEYLLEIHLQHDDQVIYYYTRIIEPVDSYVSECVDFVLDFSEKTFQEETSGTLATYMDATTEADDNLHYVTLGNSLSQVTWGDFKGERLTDPVASIKEINSSYSVIVLKYVVASVGENGENEYYNIEEYYRVRYTANRMYLLNFERTMSQIFRGENHSFYDNNIQLGIRSDEVEYKANEAGNIVCFVQEGELWCYNVTENQLAQVFSFRGYEGIDARENYDQHDIKIIDIDEAGSINYIVYGYMNRGEHEGQVGISVYHYDGIANTNEEELFIPTTQSYEVMKEELGQIMYENEEGKFFLMMSGNIYEVDLESLEMTELVTDLTDDSYAVSESNRYVAWVEDPEASTTIHLLDFKTGNTSEIKESDSEYVKPLGFMEEDFVYGVAHQADVLVDTAGKLTFPMYQIKIVDTSEEEHEVLKTYQKEGYYISDITLSNYTIYLNRIQFNGTAYVAADQDTIMNREGKESDIVSVNTTVTEEKQTQVQLSLADEVSEKSAKLLTPKQIIVEEERVLAVEDQEEKDRYYVYAKGKVLLTTDSVTEAITLANEQMGVVIGDEQQYIWKRAKKTTQSAFSDIFVGEEDTGANSVIQCINAMLEKEGINISVSALIHEGATPKEVLKNTMKDATVFDLSGCNVEEVLYYVNRGTPVFAMTGSDTAVLIVGYDANNISVFYPESQTISKVGLNDANEIFTNAGNVFFTYLTE
ncbi:MAG: hypothetical protein ACI4ES_06900 [Roseburia sp.]